MENTLSAILDNIQISQLNTMQQQMLEATANHPDIMLLSATGSGKTLAFLLPLVSELDSALRAAQALIIVPSRELALQIEGVFRQLKSGIAVTCCYGGHKREIEENNLLEKPALIIGTPGRICDHIRRGNIQTAGIHTLVLDEFDKSLEFGFETEINFIAGSLTGLQRRRLISATAPAVLPEFLQTDALHILNFTEGNESSAQATGLECMLFKFEGQQRDEAVFQLICTLGGRSSILFCNQRDWVEQLYASLKAKGLGCVYYHGAMEQRDRDTALNRFRNGTVNLLITTDLASRGLDIPHIRYIIHYQLPESKEIFIHRNGRTARMDSSGAAIVVLGPDQYLPEYMDPEMPVIEASSDAPLPPQPKWVTLHVGAGKKDKVGKIDIVGFLTKTAGLKKEDIGLIEVKDYTAYVAISRHKVTRVLAEIQDKRLKNKKIKIEIAR